MTTIGMIGLGNMGGRIASRITGAGIDLLGYDRDAEAIVRCGARAAASAREVAESSDVVLLSLPDSAVVESVVLGDEGVLASARDGQLIVDLSTAAPDSTVRIATALAARGALYVDAGVSGGAAAAEKGTLTIMAGGAPGSVDLARPHLAPFASTVYDMGGVGSGHTTKLLNNFLNAVSLSATAEVMVAGKAAGLDLHRLLDVINASSGVSFASLNRFPRIVDGDYLEGGLTSGLMMKDVLLYVEHLRELGVPSLNASAPVATFGVALARGYGTQISNRVVDAIGDLAGGIRLYDGPAATNGNDR